MNNKVAVVTGAYGFLGKKVSYLLAKKGYILVLIGLNKSKLKDLLKNIKKYSPHSCYFVCDIRKQKQVAIIMNKLFRKFEHIDVLINIAGEGHNADFKDMSFLDARDIFETNYWGCAYLIKGIVPYMISKKSGKIINVSSLGGKLALPGLSAYSASKSALIGLSESLYYELRKYNISVSLICPGKFCRGKVPLTNIFGVSVDEVAKTIVKSISEKKFEYVLPKRAILFLAAKLIRQVLS